MGACHAMVQRAVPESLGLCGPPPGLDHLIPKLENPPPLDALDQYCDDGILCGSQVNVGRCINQLCQHMPKLGLRFSKLDVIPATPGSQDAEQHEWQAIGGNLIPDGDFQTMKCPIGTNAHCDKFHQQRVDALSEACAAIAGLPSAQAALYLLRCQAGRMIYMIRTSPSEQCGQAAARADKVTKIAVENIIDTGIEPENSCAPSCQSDSGDWASNRLQRSPTQPSSPQPPGPKIVSTPCRGGVGGGRRRARKNQKTRTQN